MSGLNSFAVTPSIVHAPDTPNTFPYRTGMGMISSAEWNVFFDDFVGGVTTNVPAGWSAAIIDAGATVTIDTTATTSANGVLAIADATASEGAAIYLSKGIQLIAGKRFFLEARIRTDDITDNVFQIGLSDLTAVVNPEDLWTTTAANLVSFGILDGSAATVMLADKSNSGSTAQTGTRSIVANTWTTLAIGYDGSKLRGYVNGKESLTWDRASTTIPTAVALAPFVGALSGNGAGGNVNLVDYFRFVSER